MKRSNFLFESVLMAVTAVLAFSALISEEAVFLGALWLIILGTLQVVHSLILGACYWLNERIRKSIIFYWIGVAVNFGVMFTGNRTILSDSVTLITVLIFPLILAAYLWYITYSSRLQKLAAETGMEGEYKG